MSQSDRERINILIVDDRPEKVLALEAALEDLHQNVVRAYSGREALRRVLHDDFAVILLDVNMPDIDGFETASLIRQRRASAHVPIIFITSFADDMFVERGYALGAVDYILSPPSPDVLRTKVSVFVDLHRKTAQIRQQARRLEDRAVQLQKLAAASLTINSALATDTMLQAVADSARDIIGAHHASILMVPDNSWSHARCVVSVSEKYAGWAHTPRRPSDGDASILSWPRGKPIRLTRHELEPDSERDRDPGCGPIPLRGLLTVPLTGRGGRSLGMIQLSDRTEGEFTEEDEVLLLQLAQMCSIAVENAIFFEEREANKIKDEFLSTVSHELRTPLQALLGWSKILISNEDLDPQVSHGLQIIHKNVRTQAKLIEDLLDVSRISSGKLEIQVQPIRMREVVLAAVDTVRPAAEEKGLDLCLVLETEEDELLGDPGRLQQVVWNLLTNAVKFTPQAGRVQVSMCRLDGSLCVSVSDTGQGISPSFLPRIFDRFKQYDSSSTRSQGGLGIGLSIARHIVDLHGGNIEASSDGPNQGATLTITLPAVPGHAGAIQPSEADNGSGPLERVLNGIRVLVVEDEPDAREIIAYTLRRAGATVHGCACARDGLAALEHESPDVLVSDIAMSGQDGYEFIRAVRVVQSGRWSTMPAVALTAYASEDDRLRALANGFQMHLAKPVEPAALVSALVELVREKRKGSDSRDAGRQNGTGGLGAKVAAIQTGIVPATSGGPVAVSPPVDSGSVA